VTSHNSCTGSDRKDKLVEELLLVFVGSLPSLESCVLGFRMAALLEEVVQRR
jgi:hypothetical protein